MFGLDPIDVLIALAYGTVPVVFAITMHEVAHGWAAKQLGDPTAYRLGRLSANPIRHVDPIGTVVVPLGLALLSGGSMMFGWAKPVPVDFRNLRNPRRDMVLVAAAGPGANLVMATFWALVAMLVVGLDMHATLVGGMVVLAARLGMWFNVLLMVFNLIPIPPLDGGRVLAGVLPRRGAEFLGRIEPIGFIIVLLLVVGPVPLLWNVIEPFFRFFVDFFFSAAGIV